VRTITGVATSITAFLGRALRGPVNEPKTINNFGDFERTFGGLWKESTLGYAVRDFFLNGGSQAIVVRLYNPEKDTKTSQAINEKAEIVFDDLSLEAANEGKWGANLRIDADVDVSEDVALRMGLEKEDLFNLIVKEVEGKKIKSIERFLNISVKNSSRRIDKVLNEESKLVSFAGDWPKEDKDVPKLQKIKDAHATAKKLTEAKKKLDEAKKANPQVPGDIKKAEDELKKAEVDSANANEKLHDAKTMSEGMLPELKNKLDEAKKALDSAKNADPQVPEEITNAAAALKEVQDELANESAKIEDPVSDGLALTKADNFTPTNAQADKKGLYALERADLFNLLCIPPYKDGDVEPSLVSDASAYCEKRRAMLIVDPPSNWKDKDTAKDRFSDPNTDFVGTRSKNAAIFFPRLRQPNPLNDNQIEEFVPCGTVAGVFARTDTQRGVWKAPAGQDAALVGVPQLSVSLTDDENGELNTLGINCLRAFPIVGRVVWGARTLRGADQLADEWKYIPIRRMALFIEESLYRGTKWVVFEPNDEPLWAQIRLNIGAFMHNLFRQGAFQGSTPRDAYYVKCDKETTTQADINLGIVNIVVGFAPLKPAEFVLIKLQQMAGQIET
jgi:phage tail sheath protein FI